MLGAGYEAAVLTFLALRVGQAASGASAEAGEDARVLAAVARGERAGLRTLYQRHAGRALAIALRIMSGDRHSRAEAEEVVQDTFLEVWRRAAQYDQSRGSAGVWIATIARSRAIDRVRARGTAERTASAAAAEPHSEPPGVLEEVEQRSLRERIAAALGELPAEQRTAIELAYFEGLSQREIAARTGAPLGTVKSRVRIALGRLASVFGATGGDR
ncbi:MAG: sigma-70 family RNA polymerase sigma factor [Deltaproteobacteria bacterium]|nr:sigma-70 family RNA polymerase sigma factor [Deltaproteobacteria bacterium]